MRSLPLKCKFYFLLFKLKYNSCKSYFSTIWQTKNVFQQIAISAAIWALDWWNCLRRHWMNPKVNDYYNSKFMDLFFPILYKFVLSSNPHYFTELNICTLMFWKSFQKQSLAIWSQKLSLLQHQIGNTMFFLKILKVHFATGTTNLNGLAVNFKIGFKHVSLTDIQITLSSDLMV